MSGSRRPVASPRVEGGPSRSMAPLAALVGLLLVAGISLILLFGGLNLPGLGGGPGNVGV